MLKSLPGVNCDDVLNCANREEEFTEEMMRIAFPNQKFARRWMIAGQDQAKKALAVAVYNHYKRIINVSRAEEVELQKSNILLLGRLAW